MRARHDNAGVDCESLASHDPFLHAARDYGLEQLAQEIALAKPPVAVLGEGRMIGNLTVEPQSTEPAVRQIEVDLLAQSTLGANAEAVAHNQHPDHQLGIDRGSSYLAVVAFKMRPNFRQIDEAVDLAQEVIVRDMTLKAEAVEQRLLHPPPFAHHRVSPRFTVKSESAARHRGERLFQHRVRAGALLRRPIRSARMWKRRPFNGLF